MQVFEPHSLHVNRALFLLLNAVMVLSHTQTSLPCTQRSVMVKWRLLKQNVEALKKKKKRLVFLYHFSALCRLTEATSFPKLR